ncbi:hypothetical protein NDU88_004704 [Pleurodeles waltl]|uniref:Uncharacterized protein n=1 Tax=Pleurodeles waltl TaxID=8319 RepID=A0AAV7LM50_PLEWA|nr:hypothetical protein NDU88_004704 [Pleurodeles waltl]
MHPRTAKGRPVTRSFLEAIFSSREDIHVVKKELLTDLHEVLRDMDAADERVSHLEYQTTSWDEKIEQLQQEILRLSDQLIDLQAHAEDLKNLSKCNKICIKGAPRGAEGTDIEAYVQDLFRSILGPSPI